MGKKSMKQINIIQHIQAFYRKYSDVTPFLMVNILGTEILFNLKFFIHKFD